MCIVKSLWRHHTSHFCNNLYQADSVEHENLQHCLNSISRQVSAESELILLFLAPLAMAEVNWSPPSKILFRVPCTFTSPVPNTLTFSVYFYAGIYWWSWNIIVAMSSNLLSLFKSTPTSGTCKRMIKFLAMLCYDLYCTNPNRLRWHLRIFICHKQHNQM